VLQHPLGEEVQFDQYQRLLRVDLPGDLTLTAAQQTGAVKPCQARTPRRVALFNSSPTLTSKAAM
jgi:hypothetical protein